MSVQRKKESKRKCDMVSTFTCTAELRYNYSSTTSCNANKLKGAISSINLLRGPVVEKHCWLLVLEFSPKFDIKTFFKENVIKFKLSYSKYTCLVCVRLVLEEHGGFKAAFSHPVLRDPESVHIFTPSHLQRTRLGEVGAPCHPIL